MTDAGYRTIDHTADVAVELWAPSEEALLVEAARAAIGIITEDAAFEGGDERSVEIESADEEDRLVRWINEVLWLSTRDGFLLADADITLHEGGLRARVRGASEARGLVVTEIKAATYHDLHLAKESSGRYVARVVFDV